MKQMDLTSMKLIMESVTIKKDEKLDNDAHTKYDSHLFTSYKLV